VARSSAGRHHDVAENVMEAVERDWTNGNIAELRLDEALKFTWNRLCADVMQ
jgi:hypothetical protein